MRKHPSNLPFLPFMNGEAVIIWRRRPHVFYYRRRSEAVFKLNAVLQVLSFPRLQRAFDLYQIFLFVLKSRMC